MYDIEQPILASTREPTRDRQGNVGEYEGLHLRQNAEGRYETEFQLKLSGARDNRIGAGAPGEHSLERYTWIKNSLRTLFGTLGGEQELEFAYHWPAGFGETRSMGWSATGRCTSTASSRSLALANDLRHSLEAILEQAGLELTRHRIGRARTIDQSAWRRELAPRGIVVPCASKRLLGFAPAQSSMARVIIGMPRIAPGNPLEQFAMAGIHRGREVALSVRLVPIRLSWRAIRVLRSAHGTLADGPLDGVEFEVDGRGYITDQTLLAALLHRLTLWGTEPRGYRVHCELVASQPIPNVLAELLGSDIWGVPVSIRRPSARRLLTSGEHGATLHLDHCIHSTEVPLNLIPSIDRVHTLGVPRAYAGASIDFPPDGLLLGHCGSAKDSRLVRVSEADRSRHCYIIGATGAGKSTLLQQMVIQDMERGAGLCLIDPHGDLFEQVLQAVPSHRADDVILMDLTDFGYSIGLNFLECRGPMKALQMNFIVNELLAIFTRLYDMKVVGGPVFETYMRNALLTVMDKVHGQATLMDVNRFFENAEFRSSTIKQCRNPIAASFWKNQALCTTGETSFTNMGPYITSKLNQFTHNALIRPIIGQTRSTIDFRKAMDEGQIVLINLAKGLLGEVDTRLLGMLLLGKIVNAAMGRVSLPLQERRRFYLYIDEFQTLATPTVIGLLSEARKFGLSLIMANQHLAQLTTGEDSRGVAESILGNVATMLFFRVGNRDALELESYTRPILDAYDLQHLPDYHVACQMLSHNVPIDPFVMKTLPMPPPGWHTPEGIMLAGYIRQRNRQVYARPRAEVDKEIMRSWENNDRSEDSDSNTSDFPIFWLNDDLGEGDASPA